MNILRLIQANYYAFILIYGVCIFMLVVYFALWRHRGKILIRIKTPLKEFRIWKKPDSDGQTIKMSNEWSFTYTRDSLISFTSWFRLRQAIDVFHDSLTACHWDYLNEEVDQPKLTKAGVREYARAEVVKARFKGFAKLPLPPLFWLVLIGVIITIVLQIMMMQGVRI